MTETKLRPICYPCNEDIDTTIHGMVADLLDNMSRTQDKAMNTIYDDRVKRHEDEED